MTIVDRINRDMTEAMKSREALRLSALRMIKTALKHRETEIMKPLDDAEAARVLSSLLKQRRDAAQQYRIGGREDLARKEEEEARIIQSYLPEEASQEEILQAIEQAVAETGASSIKQMGAVIKAARARLEGKTFDGKALTDMVRARLSG
jgi:hypothetical protein